MTEKYNNNRNLSKWLNKSKIIKTPGVADAVLQTPLLFNSSLIRSAMICVILSFSIFKTLNIPTRKRTQNYFDVTFKKNHLFTKDDFWLLDWLKITQLHNIY